MSSPDRPRLVCKMHVWLYIQNICWILEKNPEHRADELRELMESHQTWCSFFSDENNALTARATSSSLSMDNLAHTYVDDKLSSHILTILLSLKSTVSLQLFLKDSFSKYSITLQTYFTNSKAGLLRGKWEPGNRGNSLLGSARECLSPDSVWWIFWVILKGKRVTKCDDYAA